MNYMVQSFIADLMNERLQEIGLRLPPGAKLVAQIHDAAIFQCPDERVKELDEVLIDVWKRPVVVPHNGKSFVMPIDKKVGQRWSDFG